MPLRKGGAIEGSRTLDLSITNRLLYQLSYDGALPLLTDVFTDVFTDSDETFAQPRHQRKVEGARTVDPPF